MPDYEFLMLASGLGGYKNKCLQGTCGTHKLQSCSRYRALSVKLIVLRSPTPGLFDCLLKFPEGQTKQPSKTYPPACLPPGATSLKPRLLIENHKVSVLGMVKQEVLLRKKKKD